MKFLHVLLVWKIFSMPSLCSWTFWHSKSWHDVLAGALKYMKNQGSLSLNPVEVDTILSPSPKGCPLCRRMTSNLTLHRCGLERSSPGGKLVKNTMLVFVWGYGKGVMAERIWGCGPVEEGLLECTKARIQAPALWVGEDGEEWTERLTGHNQILLSVESARHR